MGCRSLRIGYVQEADEQSSGACQAAIARSAWPDGRNSQRPQSRPPDAQNGAVRFAVGVQKRIGNVLSDRRRRRRLIAGTILAVSFVLLVRWWLLRPLETGVLEIQPRPIELVLSVVGRVRPENLIDVRSQNAGLIVALLSDDGDTVEAGAALAIVRSTVAQAQADAGTAREVAARAELTRAKLALDRTTILAERGFVSEDALEEARAAFTSKEAALAAAAAERRGASAQAGEFTIRAPMAGIILFRSVDPGQVISPETTLFELGSRGGVEVHAEVDEVYADALRPGMPARAALSGSDRVFEAYVAAVSPRVDATTGGRLVKLEPVDAMELPPGRSVDITIVVERRPHGVSVPRSAVIDAATRPAVYIVDPRGIVAVRPIEILDWPSLDAIVESGLVGGDRIVLAPGDTRPSDRVRVRLESAVSAAGR